MHPYTLHLLAKTLHDERLAAANAARQVRMFRESKKPGNRVELPGPAPTTTPVCYTA